MKNRMLIIFVALLIIGLISSVSAETCGVYFTNIGCPHCAIADPIVLGEMISSYPDFVVIEYELTQLAENGPLFFEYDNKYFNLGINLGVPFIAFSENSFFVGDKSIKDSIEDIIKQGESQCLLLNKSVSFQELDITELPARPKIWKSNRILVHIGGQGDGEVLKSLLVGNLSEILSKINYTGIEPEIIPWSGKKVEFDNAIQVGGWLFQWDGYPYIDASGELNFTIIVPRDTQLDLTFAKIVSLAAVDAINPCAIAVLVLILVSILTYNPEKKSKVLTAGFAFIIAIFLMYLFYGLVIIKFFQLVQFLSGARLILYKLFGIGAIILGLLNIKDYFKYRPGGIATEMPISMRPVMKRIVSGVTSPKGAFIVGLFVTLFLLPCTIGPYIIAGGILSTLELVKTLLWLLIYNFIFVLPMIIITLIVYAGFTKVEDVGGWKERNIRYLHLIAGVIMFVLGITMIFGWL